MSAPAPAARVQGHNAAFAGHAVAWRSDGPLDWDVGVVPAGAAGNEDEVAVNAAQGAAALGTADAAALLVADPVSEACLRRPEELTADWDPD